MKLNRRTMLRGAFGTALGLPLLECMLNGSGTAHADGSELPKRYFMFFCPTAICCNWSRGEEAMTPTTVGPDYEITRALEPLEERGLKGDVSVVSGLYCAPHAGPAGAYNVDYHGQAYKALLTGTSAGFDADRYQLNGPSVDEALAQDMPEDMRFRKLYFQIDPVATTHHLSYERRGDGYQRVDPETSPANAFRTLFGDFSEASAAPDPQVLLERRLRESSLSYANEQIQRLTRRLGAADRQTLDGHFTHIRELERRLLAAAPASMIGACDSPAERNDPAELGPSLPDHDTRASIFMELIRLAFACDMTRVITLSATGTFTSDGMRHSLWERYGGLHGSVQHGNPDQGPLDEANRLFVDIYSSVLEGLKATPEGEGNLLDSSAGVFLMEGGKGIGDPSRSGDGGHSINHSCDHMLMLMGGRAGGLRPKGHIDVYGADHHPAAVLNGAMRAVGSSRTLGEVTNVVEEIF